MRNRATAATSDECFQEKRNMEDLWKTIFLVGTEWDQFYKGYQFKWNFSNLEDAFEENGVLHGNKVYLFSCTESQCLPVYDEEKVILFPVVVAVVSPFPPSDKIGINSVQMEAEEIVPMNQMKMDWVPYIPLLPLAYKDSQVDRLKFHIFILSCTQGRERCRRKCGVCFLWRWLYEICAIPGTESNSYRAAMRNLEKERIKKYKYCLPYFYQPFKEDEFEQSTVVDFFFPAEPPVVSEFDWELDELEEFVDEKVTSGDIIEDQKDDFKNFVREKVKEAKNANREAKEARKKAVEEMSVDTKTAYDNMWFYKFYPVQSPDTPDVSSVKSPFINRYYGKAHEVL